MTGLATPDDATGDRPRRRCSSRGRWSPRHFREHLSNPRAGADLRPEKSCNLDAAALLPAPVENAAHREDLHGQVGFLDRHARPHHIEDLVFGDQLAPPLDQEGEQGARANRASPARRYQGRSCETDNRRRDRSESFRTRKSPPNRTHLRALPPATPSSLQRASLQPSVGLLCEPVHTVPKHSSVPFDGSRPGATRAVRSDDSNHVDERSLEIFGQIWKFFRPAS